jgi:hypothetical protein
VSERSRYDCLISLDVYVDRRDAAMDEDKFEHPQAVSVLTGVLRRSSFGALPLSSHFPGERNQIKVTYAK